VDTEPRSFIGLLFVRTQQPELLRLRLRLKMKE